MKLSFDYSMFKMNRFAVSFPGQVFQLELFSKPFQVLLYPYKGLRRYKETKGALDCTMRRCGKKQIHEKSLQQLACSGIVLLVVMLKVSKNTFFFFKQVPIRSNLV
jgi:hypothetical protein